MLMTVYGWTDEYHHPSFLQNGDIKSCVRSRECPVQRKYALRSRSSRPQNIYGSVTVLVKSVMFKDYAPAEDQKIKIH